MNRRRFLQRTLEFCAIVALAPRLAFRDPITPIAPDNLDTLWSKVFWSQSKCEFRCYSEAYLRAVRLLPVEDGTIEYKHERE